ncbi:MAG: type II toxin-antitoxin system PemK/MazF family toxin [Acidimicrobiales bacterium]
MGVVARGELWWMDFGDRVGSEPAYRRPALVVSSDRFNRSRMATVVVAAVSSNRRLAEMPGNVALAPGGTGLSKPSVVNVSQLLTVDRGRLEARAGRIGAPQVRAVDEGLRLVLGL